MKMIIHMNLFISYLILVGIGLTTPSYVFAAERVNIFTYDKRPPYVIEDDNSRNIQQQGIYIDFVNYLNAQQNDFDFELHFLPRVRLDGLLKSNNLDGIVIGVNPTWFSDTKREKYLWTSAIMNDKNVLLVNDKLKYNSYIKNEQFIGNRIAITRGTYHKGMSELIEQGKIDVFLTNNEMQSLAMMSHNRADFTIVSGLTLGYFLMHHEVQEKLHVLNPPHYEYERMILVPKNKISLFKIINQLVEQAEFDQNWIKQLKKWNKLSFTSLDMLKHNKKDALNMDKQPIINIR